MSNTVKKERRPPVVAIMGHIDHGKSTLLDSIRKTNITEKETGGITQHLGAYEVVHTGKDGESRRITFLDTPGHEAFFTIRECGARVADVGILVVSAEDGVKPQTLEALACMKKDSLPFVVAVNKIDKPGVNIERTKQNLAENEVFLEGYGGGVPWAAISAKTGQGVYDLLDLVILVSELEELFGDVDAPGEGVIVESNLNTQKGITATAIVKNGTVRKGEFAVSGKSISPLRILEDFGGTPIASATFSSPIRIVGWDSPPIVGETFRTFTTKQLAIEAAEKAEERKRETRTSAKEADERVTVAIVIKADTSGGLDAVRYEIDRIRSEAVRVRVVLAGIGPISENDVKTANVKGALVVGFNTKIEQGAENLALRTNVTVKTFDIIYALVEWLMEEVLKRTPTVLVDETSGVAKILKTFGRTKDKQVVGGRVEGGVISTGDAVKILRRGAEIGHGKVRELQEQKVKVSTVKEGDEFGVQVESKIEIVPGDKLECFSVVRK